MGISMGWLLEVIDVFTDGDANEETEKYAYAMFMLSVGWFYKKGMYACHGI